MTEKGILKVFVSSTYRDLKKVRGLLITGIEEALEAVAMEKFPPSDESSHKKSIEYLEDSDISIFIIGDYYGTVLKKCEIREDACGDCSNISYTHCEYRRTIQSGKPYLLYVVENELSKVLSKIPHFDLQSTHEGDILKFLRENNIDISKIHLFSGYTLEEIEELWRIATDKNRRELKEFKNEIKGLYRQVKIVRKEDYYVFHETVRKDLKVNLMEWYKKGKVTFAQFAGRRTELDELLKKVDKENSVCIVGTGGVGKTSLIQVGLLLEKLSGRDVYAFYKEYSYKYTKAGYLFAKGRFMENAFREQLTLTDILKVIFQKHDTLEDILKMDRDKKMSILVDELNRKNSILFVDDLQDAEDDVKKFVYWCGNNLRTGAVVAGAREKGNCYSLIGPLPGLKGQDLKDMIRITAETHSTDKYVVDDLDTWCGEVSRITQGHPMLVDIMVRNAQHFPDFEKLKGITGVTPVEDQEAVNEVMKRLIEDILTDEEREALTLLSVFHLPVDKRILDEVGKVVDGIIRKGFLDWVDGQLVFTFDAVRELLEVRASGECHDLAVGYYSGETEKVSEVVNPDICVEIVYHLIKGRRYEEASRMYFDNSKMLERARGRAVEVSRLLLENTEGEKRAFILGTLGNLLLKGREFSAVEDCYVEILEVFRKLAQKDPTAYESDVAMTLNNLGTLYWNLRDFEKARESYEEALQIRRRLAQKDPTAYESDVAMTLNNLGNLYSDLRDFEKAEESYEEALQIRRKLAQKDPTAYESYVATTLNNLGTLYWNLRDFEKAEESYEEALQIRRKLAQKDPTAYESDVAMTLNNLGTLYSDLRDFEKAEESYEEALQIRRKLAQKDPTAYESDVAMTLNNLGTLYSDLRDFEKAEESYEEALQIRRKLAQKDPTAYESYVATTLNNLGNLYWNLRDFEKAEESYEEALIHKDSLPDNGARIYLGLAALSEETQKENASQLYFTAGVISFNVFALYRLPSIDIHYCFQKTLELSPTSSQINRMAQIVIASISKIIKASQPTAQLASLIVDDLPEMCQAVVTLLINGKTIPVKEPENDIDCMFYILYQQLKNLQEGSSKLS